MEKEIKELERKLPEDVAKKYRMKTIRAAKYNFAGFGEIDLRTISVAKADDLYAKKFPYLEKLPDAVASDEAKEAEKLAKVENAKKELAELDLSAIEKFDYNKAKSIVKILEIPVPDNKKETLFDTLSKLPKQ